MRKQILERLVADSARGMLAKAGLSNLLHGDSFTGSGVFFARQLESVIAEVFEVQYPEFKYANFIPARSGVDAGAEAWTYRIYDVTGEATFIDDMAGDLPEVGLVGAEAIKPIRSIGASFGWSIQDVRAAALGRVPLDRMKPEAARKMIERKIESIFALGDTTRGIEGFVNNTLIDDVSPTTGSWSTATGEQILTDLNKLVNAVVTASKETFAPDTLLLPVSSFTLISAKPYSAQDSTSVLATFMKNTPYIRNVDCWHFLDTADSGTDPRAIAYKRDPMVLDYVLPVPFEVLPPQPQNLRTSFPCHARVGGVTLRYPIGIAKMDGI